MSLRKRTGGKRVMTRKIFALCLFVFLVGCRSNTAPTYHIRQDMDFSYIKRVAVLPFKNLSGYRDGDEIIRQYVLNELLSAGYMDVSVPGDVPPALNRLGIKQISSLTANEIKAIAKELNVQAVIFGTVETWGFIRVGVVDVPEITLTLMMADGTSGDIIWSVTYSESGNNFVSRHLGFQSKTLTEIGLRAVKNAIQTLSKY